MQPKGAVYTGADHPADLQSENKKTHTDCYPHRLRTWAPTEQTETYSDQTRSPHPRFRPSKQTWTPDEQANTDIGKRITEGSARTNPECIQEPCGDRNPHRRQNKQKKADLTKRSVCRYLHRPSDKRREGAWKIYNAGENLRWRPHRTYTYKNQQTATKSAPTKTRKHPQIATCTDAESGHRMNKQTPAPAGGVQGEAQEPTLKTSWNPVKTETHIGNNTREKR